MSKSHDFTLAHAEHIESEAGNIGLRCKCGKAAGHVVYIVTETLPPATNPLTNTRYAGMPAGPYCFKCLAAAVLAAGRVPTPMSEDLFDKLRAELTGESHPGKPLKTMITI